MNFPHECARCGFCCLAQLCPAMRQGAARPCTHLSFNGDEANCHLAPLIVPVGDGCCIKARAYRKGEEFDFAGLPKWQKIMAVRQSRGMPAWRQA